MKNKYFKVWIGVILLIGIIFEWYPMYVDMYNFRQLEKAKPILESIPEDAYKFNTLKDFNERYDANIQPIKNCYYIGSSNGEEKYLFWLQLESRYFKK